MTEASQRALHGLRDLSTLHWYVVPMLAFVFYIYVKEIKDARTTGVWDAVFAGLTLFGMDCLNETVNGWILHLSQRSALWTVVGPSALRTMVGWNIEIMFMFAIGGIVYYHTLSPDRPRPLVASREAWLVAAGYSAFCVFVEILLWKGGIFVWEYPFWHASFKGVWLIFLLGYFHFYAAVIVILSLRSNGAKAAAVSGIYAVAVVANVVAMGVLGWTY